MRDARERGIQPEWKAPVDQDTDVVIEGFPRSANTFAATAFELAQPNAVKVARHLHVPAQIIGGLRLGIPTMVLVRDPVDAVLSLVVRTPWMTLKQGLKEYVRFHERILPYQDDFVVARFDEVATDFGLVIRRLNQRFGTSFREFDHSEANVSLCYEIIQPHAHIGGSHVPVAMSSVPSLEREVMKDRLRSAIRSPRLATARSEARNLYEALTSR